MEHILPERNGYRHWAPSTINSQRPTRRHRCKSRMTQDSSGGKPLRPDDDQICFFGRRFFLLFANLCNRFLQSGSHCFHYFHGLELNKTCQRSRLQDMPNAEHVTEGVPTYVNAPICLYGHIDEQSVRFKNLHRKCSGEQLLVAWKMMCFRDENRQLHAFFGP